jgi:hypothetical protein
METACSDHKVRIPWNIVKREGKYHQYWPDQPAQFDEQAYVREWCRIYNAYKSSFALIVLIKVSWIALII